VQLANRVSGCPRPQGGGQASCARSDADGAVRVDDPVGLRAESSVSVQSAQDCFAEGGERLFSRDSR
jgi:hypothetical protein